MSALLSRYQSLRWKLTWSYTWVAAVTFLIIATVLMVVLTIGLGTTGASLGLALQREDGNFELVVGTQRLARRVPFHGCPGTVQRYLCIVECVHVETGEKTAGRKVRIRKAGIADFQPLFADAARQAEPQLAPEAQLATDVEACLAFGDPVPGEVDQKFEDRPQIHE